MRNGHRSADDAPRPAGPSALRVPIACCWLLMSVTFSAPGRDSPRNTDGLDYIGLAKLAVRGLVVLLMARELARGWNSPRRPAVVWCLTPFAAFIGWALVTAAWSPMLVISAGQWGSLLAQVLLAGVIALKWESSRDTSALLRHLCLALAAVSGFLVAVHLVMPDLSGLSREDFAEEVSNGLVHPTSAGATASLGLLLLIGSRVLWGWDWTRKLLVPGLLASAALLALAHSRTALAMTLVILGVLFLCYTSVRARAAAMIGGGLLVAGYVVADPGLSAIGDLQRDANEYLRRGESDEQMSQLNGRGELWDELFREFQHSPLVGHGYFMTTRTGWMYCWQVPGVRTAHNFTLQVMASTGLIGLGLFLWALGRPVRAAAAGLHGGGETARLRGFLLLVGAFYLGWGQLCESFMGPVQPESVTFYGLFGLAVAQASRWREANA